MIRGLLPFCSNPSGFIRFTFAHESLDEHSAGVPFGIAVMLHVNAVQLDTGDLVQRLADILRICQPIFSTPS